MASSKIVFVLVCCIFFYVYGATVNRQGRSLPVTNSSQTAKDICIRSTPCGWAVYHRYSRDIDYFMKNKCECPEGKKCIRTDDDISVTAYVYRCKDPQKDTGNES